MVMSFKSRVERAARVIKWYLVGSVVVWGRLFVVVVSGAFTMTRVIFSCCFCFGVFVCSNWEKLGGNYANG